MSPAPRARGRWRDVWRRFRGAGAYPHELAFLLTLPGRRWLQPPADLADALALRPGARVLELGPGPGFFSPELARRVPGGALVLGDVQREMLRKARRRLRRAVPRARALAVQADAGALPFADGAFDAAVLVAVLGEVGDARACLSELRRVLAPDGLLSVTEVWGDPDAVPAERVAGLAAEAGFAPAPEASRRGRRDRTDAFRAAEAPGRVRGGEGAAPDPAALRAFWLGSAAGDPDLAGAALPRWFGTDPELDETVRRRFASWLGAAGRGELDGWAATPEGALALVLLADQVPRNAHRDDPRAFAYDPLARDVSLAGIARGRDRRLGPVERAFFYLPLEHAEDAALQEESVRRFRGLRDEHGPGSPWWPLLDGFLAFAIDHRDAVLRFGRFPWRNAVLGRASSGEEEAWLAARETGPSTRSAPA